MQMILLKEITHSSSTPLASTMTRLVVEEPEPLLAIREISTWDNCIITIFNKEETLLWTIQKKELYTTFHQLYAVSLTREVSTSSKQLRKRMNPLSMTTLGKTWMKTLSSIPNFILKRTEDRLCSALNLHQLNTLRIQWTLGVTMRISNTLSR
jgi:hypothetical protein